MRGSCGERLAHPPQRHADAAASTLHLLPGGRALLVAGQPNEETSFRIEALDLDTGKTSPIIDGLTSERAFGDAVYAAPGANATHGHIVYGTPGSVFAVPIDAQRLRRSGPSVPISGLSVPISVSAQGTVAYLVGISGQDNLRQLAWVDSEGREQAVGPPRLYQAPLRLSPDGNKLAVQIAGDVWIVDLAVGRATQLSSGTPSGNPAWSRDGTRVYYTTVAGQGTTAIASMRADRGGPPVIVTKDAGQYVVSDVAPDGALLARREDPSKLDGPSVYLAIPVSANGTKAGVERPFLTARSRMQNLRISPGGDFVAYQVLENERTEIEVAPYPGPGGIVRISIDGGAAPQWSEDGRKLFYINSGRLMAVDVVRTTPVFEARPPKTVLERLLPPYACRGRASSSFASRVALTRSPMKCTSL